MCLYDYLKILWCVYDVSMR